jgi:glycosyltransferase involved in cell wall biosynthesis
MRIHDPKETIPMPPDNWPLISIVTPSFNQAKFLEETILSIKDQDYKFVEHIVIDGGSTDGSYEILEKYSDSLKFWVSEPDEGQAHAINKGLRHCSGQIFNWINSDDLLLPGALTTIAEAWRQHPGHVLVGDTLILDSINGGSTYIKHRGVTLENMIRIWEGGRMNWVQPGTFLPLDVLTQVGPIDQTLRYTFDRDLMCRILRTAPVSYLGSALASFRLQPNSKTVYEAENWATEHALVSLRYADEVEDLDARLVEAECTLCWNILPKISGRWQRPKRFAALAGLVRIAWRCPKILISKRFYLATLLLALPGKLARRVIQAIEQCKVSR